MPPVYIPPTTPAPNAVEVPIDQTIAITFNHRSSLGFGSVLLTNGNDDTRRIAIHDASQVTLTNYFSANNSTLRINPQKNLLANSRYYLLADAGVLNDEAGQALPGITDPTIYRFSTSTTIDTSPPQLDTSPPQLLSNSYFSSLRFNEAIKQTGPGRILLSNHQGDQRILSIDYINKDLVTLNTGSLLPNTTYYLTIEPNAFSDFAGNNFPGTTITLTTYLLDNFYQHYPQSYELRLDLPQRPLPANANIKLISLNTYTKAGNGYIYISNGLGDMRRIAVNDSRQVTVPGNKNEVIINPLEDLWPDSEYSLSIDPGAFIDQFGYSFSLNPKDFRDTSNFFNTIAADINPPLALSGSYSEQSSYGDENGSRKLTVTFNEPIEIGFGNITISNGQSDSHLIAITDTSQVNHRERSPELEIIMQKNLLPNTQYFVLADQGILTDKLGNPFAGVNNPAVCNFTTGTIAPARNQPVQEINHPGGVVGRYEPDDRLVFNFNTPIKHYESFQLNQHSFGGNDLLLSADGLSATVSLTSDSTVTQGDRLTLSGAQDGLGNRMTLFFDL